MQRILQVHIHGEVGLGWELTWPAFPSGSGGDEFCGVTFSGSEYPDLSGSVADLGCNVKSIREQSHTCGARSDVATSA
jgi:hypothetical protein